MKLCTILLALATATASTASPLIHPTKVQERRPVPTQSHNTPGVVHFFYDTQCAEYAGQAEIAPLAQEAVGAPGFGTDNYYGGDWGSRSAYFVGLGDLQTWAIYNDPKGLQGTTDSQTTLKPALYKCVTYEGGIYAGGA